MGNERGKGKGQGMRNGYRGHEVKHSKKGG